MHPTLFKIHGIELHSYGLLLAVAFLAGIQLFLSRGTKRGLPEARLSTLALLLLVLSIVGGRGLYVLTHWTDYARDPAGIFRIWEGGLMLYGGYILAIAGGIAYARRAGLPVWRTADAAAPSMALGIAIGRLGCFMNGCCFGLPTHLSWGVHFPAGSYSSFTFPGESLHPSQLYLAAAGGGLFFLLLRLDRTRRFDGWLFWTYVALDAAFRFGIDFTRYYDSTSFLGSAWGLSFNVNQVMSGLLIITAVIMLRGLSRREREAAPAVPGSEPGPHADAPSERPEASVEAVAAPERPGPPA